MSPPVMSPQSYPSLCSLCWPFLSCSPRPSCHCCSCHTAEHLFWRPDVADIRHTLPAPHHLDEGILYPMLSCYCRCSNAEAMSAYRLQLYPSDVSASHIAFTKCSLVRNWPLSITEKGPGCCPRLTLHIFQHCRHQTELRRSSTQVDVDPFAIWVCL